MTNLHYLLIGLAVLLVGGVLVYNHIQERRLRKQIDGMFRRGLEGSTDAGADVPETNARDEAPAVAGSGGFDAMSADAGPGLAGLTVQEEDGQETYDEMLTLMRRASLDQDDEVGTSLTSLAGDEPEDGASPATPAAPAPSAIDKPAEPVPAHVDEPEPEPVRQVVAEAAPAPRETVQPAPDAAETRTHAAPPPSPLDAEVECGARLRPGHHEAVTYAALLDRLRRVGKPARAFGYIEGQGWEPVNAIRPRDYAVVEIGLQLVDRKGALARTQLDLFCDALYEFAAEYGGAVSCPDMVAVLDKARELDAFCMDVDMLIGVNIVAPEGIPFMGRRIDEAALGAGMSLNRQGAYVMADAEGHVLFTLANPSGERFIPEDRSYTTQTVTLLFDVPNVANGLDVFDRMSLFGGELARVLGGRMTDDQGHAVTQASLANDRRQLSGFYARMQERGIPAGGERAHRLFA